MFMDKTMKPYIVAGPCSVESREQLREVTEALAKIPQVQMIRAGVWKPRTRPGGFEGLGAQALAWMRELAAEYGLAYDPETLPPMGESAIYYQTGYNFRCYIYRCGAGVSRARIHCIG